MSRKDNALASMIAAHRGDPQDEEAEPENTAPLKGEVIAPAEPETSAANGTGAAAATTVEPDLPLKRSPGRPPGRSSDAAYIPITVLVPLELSMDLDEILVKLNRARKRSRQKPMDRSGVFEELLAGWVERQRKEQEQ